MHLISTFVLITSSASVLFAIPVRQGFQVNPLANPADGPIPSESSIYSDYTGKSAPFPANTTAPIPATKNGPPGPDDVLFQNLAAAEWAIFTFYQQAVEALNESSFTDLGLPNTTYQRIVEIRDNEAGHLRIFQDSISATSLKPGSCKYDYGWNSPEEFLALQNVIEVSSMAFATALAQQAKLKATIGALVAIGDTETRHEGISPFSGPVDTVFPYANEILYVTSAQFIIPGSCPPENPEYPYPSQKLPQLAYNSTTSTGQPGSPITFVYRNNSGTPEYSAGKDYHAVFFHGLVNITVPFDTKTNSSTIPAAFESDKGIILAVIADEIGAPTLDSVVAGPILRWERMVGDAIDSFIVGSSARIRFQCTGNLTRHHLFVKINLIPLFL